MEKIDIIKILIIFFGVVIMLLIKPLVKKYYNWYYNRSVIEKDIYGNNIKINKH